MNSANETILNIDLKKLEQNFNYLKAKLNPETKIIGVVKAFAYGHGDVIVSKKLEQLGVDALWVSDFNEGTILRKAGISTKIIVANPGIKSYQEIIKHRLDVVLYSHNLLDLYCSNKNKVQIHIKFNTGMNRYGFNADQIESIVSKLKNNHHLKLTSICSHLAASDDKNKTNYTLRQIKNFKILSKKFAHSLGKNVDRHLLNSHGLLNFPNHQMEAVRLGIGLYGSTTERNLKQISSLVSVIAQTRHLKKGEYLGYGTTFIAKEKMKIGIIPVGYADGINRRLSNKSGSVYINNCKCPIVGKISMDSFAVDITKCDAQERDMVEIFGKTLAVSEISKKINTIPYEIYSTLNKRIKRVYSD